MQLTGPARSVVLILIGVVLMVVGYFVYRTGQTEASWPHVSGTVVSGTPDGYSSSNRNTQQYDWVMSYQVAGQTYQYTSYNRSQYPVVGSSVDLVYNPSNPRSADMYNSPAATALAVGACELFGLISLGAGVVTLVRGKQ